MMTEVLDSIIYVHPTAVCESHEVGEGTRIWAFAHVLDGAVVGRDCNIGDHVYVEGGARVGDRVTIKNQVMIWEGVTIEDDVFVGPGAIFTNDRYPRSRKLGSATKRYARRESWLVTTTVRHGASIGAGAIIVGGVAVGRFATVGAGAVVTKDVRDHRLVAGNPARIVGWACVCGVPLCDRLCCPRCERRFRSCGDTLVAAESGGVEESGAPGARGDPNV
jgi:acetyltransferase-like isoleucine patch superfamily enzyme